MRKLLKSLGLSMAVLTSGASADAPSDNPAQVVRNAIDALCARPDLNGLEAQIAVPGSYLLEEVRQPDDQDPRRIFVRLVLAGGDELSLERRAVNGTLRQFRARFDRASGAGVTPELLAIADGGCVIRSGRALRAEGPVRRYLDQLDGDLMRVRWSEVLQIPWPEGQDPGGVRVGLIDSGLAYDLPLFRDRLARDRSGKPLGYDYWDLDPYPYDGDVARGPFLPIRHGTAVASILVREAPKAALVPYRYPRPDMSRLGNLVHRAARDGVRVLAMPLGSNVETDWVAFVSALEAHDMLAIVSAGNDSRDIDDQPVYPAASPSDRILTVTSSDAFGRLAQGSNWGAQSVDIMVSAENLDVVDFRGAHGVASGSSYAVPRVAALAARLLDAQPDLSAAALKRAILDRASPSPFESERKLATGWLPNPLED